MHKIQHIIYMAFVAGCFGILSSGCSKQDVSPASEQYDVPVWLSVGTRAVEETDGTPTIDESAIYTLRVYAFVNGRPAGHHFVEGSNLTVPANFFMDITFYSATTQMVDFYIIANEAAMSTPGSEKKFTETTTEYELNNFDFTELETSEGLPMFCKEQKKLTFTGNEGIADDPAHEDHVISNKLEFSLQRPMGKLGVFAAKVAGETGTLRVTGLKMLESGTRTRNYLMPQTEEKLKEITDIAPGFVLDVVEDEVTKEFPEDVTDAVRQDPANYTPVLATPFYPFENPYSNGGAWNIPGADGKEHVLQIDYEFDGESRTGLVYMPRIERNHYYTVCCQMHNTGKIIITYSVAEWDDEDYGELEFATPVYDFVTPYVNSELTPYAQPEVYCSDEGSYSFAFSITGPTGQKWTPAFLDATPADFEITVLQNETLVDENNYVASEEPYQIKIKALNPENVGKTARFVISYTPAWDSRNSLLLINEELNWLGSDEPDEIVIRQIDIP